MSRKVTSAPTGKAPAWASRAALAVVSAAVSFGLWLLLVDTFERPELQAGAAAAVLTAIAMVAVLRDEVVWRVAAGELRGVWKLPLRALRASLTVLLALLLHILRLRAAAGGFHTEKVDATGPGAAAATRRAFVTLTRSLPPDTAVIGLNRSRESLVFHQFPLPPGQPRRGGSGR